MVDMKRSNGSRRSHERFSNDPSLYLVNFDPRRHQDVMQAIAEHRQRTGYRGFVAIA